MLNKELPYYDIIMKADKQIACFHPILCLPDGYRYKMYEPGDEKEWAKLELSVNEFATEKEAEAYFNRVFLPFPEELEKRMCFILNQNDEFVATASAWFKKDEHRFYSVLHWVSTAPTAQGLGLGKAIVIYALSKFRDLDALTSDVFLHTQTWSYKAIGLYGKLGFKITDEPLLSSNTNPEAISVLKTVLNNEIMAMII